MFRFMVPAPVGSVLFFFFLLLLGRAAASQTTPCTLECRNGGTCAAGPADFTGHPTYSNGDEFAIFLEKQLNDMHCDCPQGWTGLQCEREFEDCNDGAHRCYHGGNCIEGSEDFFGNTRHFCDCSEATGEDGTRWVGKYCEQEVEGNACTEPGVVFCLNGGECVTEPGNVVYCQCLSGFSGRHCEYYEDSVPDCTLECANGGKCRLGYAELPDDKEYTKEFWELNKGLTYCECPDDWFGQTCRMPSVSCGDKHCFNGALCVEQIQADGTKDFFCNCTAATKVDAAFAGRYCQYEDAGFCAQAPNQNGIHFCVNGGTCPDSDLGNCTCLSEYHGPRCEYANVEDTQEYEECKTVCENGGKCAKGVKDHGFLNKNGQELHHIVKDTVNVNFEHCICPPGFAGLHCSLAIEMCPNNQDYCVNGGSCVKDPNGDGYTCDCSTSPNGAVGRLCQHSPDDGHSTVCPTSEGFPPGSFCTQYGACDTRMINGNPCVCAGGYLGDHCEYYAQLPSQPTNEPDTEPDNTPDNEPDNTPDNEPDNTPDNEPDSAPDDSLNDNDAGTVPDDIPKTGAENNSDLVFTDNSNQRVIIGIVVTVVVGLVVIVLVVARTEFSKRNDDEVPLKSNSHDLGLNGDQPMVSEKNIASGSPVV